MGRKVEEGRNARQNWPAGIPDRTLCIILLNMRRIEGQALGYRAISKVKCGLTILLPAAAVVGFVACGGGGSTVSATPTPGATETAKPAPSPTAILTDAPTATATPVLPSETASVTPAEKPYGSPATDAEFQQLLDSVYTPEILASGLPIELSRSYIYEQLQVCLGEIPPLTFDTNDKFGV